MTIDRQDSIISTKLSLMSILNRMKSSDENEATEVLKQYNQIVEQFYHENEHLMSPSQYRAALRDVKYFAVLVELADHYYEDCNF